MVSQNNTRRPDNLKHGKRPTRNQKIFIKSKKFKPENWLVVKDNSKEFVMVHKESGNIKNFKKA